MADRKAERQARKADRKRKRERARLERRIDVLLKTGTPFHVAAPDGPVNPNPSSAVLGLPSEPTVSTGTFRPEPTICCKELSACCHTQPSS